MKGSAIQCGLGANLLGKTRSAVLGLLLCNSDRSFYFREIVRVLATGPGATQRELTHLVDSGLVIRRKVGNQIHYQANTRSAVFPELKSLMIKTAGVSEVLKQALSTLIDRVCLAFVYGSFAKGTDTADSDVDVIIVGSVSFVEVVDALAPAQERLRREVNPSVYPRDEFIGKLSTGSHFLTRVIGEPKIFLIGDQDELGRLVEKRLVE